jgi:CDP-diacylglycerol--glycerol-3-phosphate 3-phosphatidyltransferase
MWTISNILTLTRIGLMPLLLVLIWPGIESRETCVWAAMLFSLGSVTDIVDGFIARSRGEVTVIGKFLDPLADKLFYLVPLIAFLQLDPPRIPAWVVLLVVIRELSITGLRAIAMSEGVVIAAGKGGKVKTFLASVGMVGLLVNHPYWMDFGFAGAVIDFHRVGLILTYLSVAFSLTSGAGYVVDFVRVVRSRPSSP